MLRNTNLAAKLKRTLCLRLLQNRRGGRHCHRQAANCFSSQPLPAVSLRRTAREAAIIHDIAVVWWNLGIAYRHLWQPERPAAEQPAAEPEGGAEGGAGREDTHEASAQRRERQQQEQQEQQAEEQEQRPQDVQQQQQGQQGQQGGGQQGGEGSDRHGSGQLPCSPVPQGGGAGATGAVSAAAALPDPIDWEPDAGVLKQLNFQPEL